MDLMDLRGYNLTNHATFCSAMACSHFHNLACRSGFSVGLSTEGIRTFSTTDSVSFRRPKMLQGQSAVTTTGVNVSSTISCFCDIDIVLPELIFELPRIFRQTFRLWLALFCHIAPR